MVALCKCKQVLARCGLGAPLYSFCHNHSGPDKSLNTQPAPQDRSRGLVSRGLRTQSDCTMERAAALPSMGLLWAPVCRRVLIPLPARESKLQAALKPWKRLSQCHIRERQFRACYACWIARTSPGGVRRALAGLCEATEAIRSSTIIRPLAASWHHCDSAASEAAISARELNRELVCRSNPACRSTSRSPLRN